MNQSVSTGAFDLEGLVHLLDHTDELMQSVSPRGELLWANRAWREALGYTSDELTSLTIQDIVAPESLPHCAEVMGRVIQGEPVPRIEAVFMARGGARVRVEGSAQARHVDGECVATFGIFRQVDLERKRDHDLRHFFDLSLDLLCIASTDGYFRILNPAWKASLGYELEELVGRPFLDFVHPEDREATIEALGALQEGQAVVGFENRYRHRDGSYRFFLWTSAPDPDPESDQVYAVARDISERMAVERLKSEFVSTVSHELRTPLTSIRGTLRLLDQGVVGELPEKAQELVRVAHSNCLRLTSLIDDILDLEKLEAGHVLLSREPVDLVALVGEVVERMGGFASEHGVRLNGPTATPVVLECDPGRVEQVLANLLSNAVKFSPEGCEVHVRIDAEEERVRVEVEDQGPGVAPEDRDRIFQRFHQGDATDRRRQGGTGLGLAIGRALVEAHGGSLGVEDVPEGGSRFWFVLPVRAP
jgi:PAS domain S-box-containing protein